jgi:hypothetical protein
MNCKHMFAARWEVLYQAGNVPAADRGKAEAASWEIR